VFLSDRRFRHFFFRGFRVFGGSLYFFGCGRRPRWVFRGLSRPSLNSLTGKLRAGRLGRSIVRRIFLSLNFPVCFSISGTSRTEFRSPIQDNSMSTTFEDSTAFSSPAMTAATGSRAEIKAVPPKEAGRVLNSMNTWIASGLTLAPIPLGLAGGIGGLVAAAYFYDKILVAAGTCAIAGLACGAGSVFVIVAFQHFLASHYLRSAARESFANRTDLLVPPGDPDAEFVDVIPRINWGAAMLEPATDMGFFKIDHSRRELLFEGDSKRYRIPFAAVTSCEVEDYALGHEKWEADLHFVTVVSFQTENGPRELPLAGKHLKLHPRRAPQRRAQATEFCSRILLALNA
jgi:hypothetical protein